jgi:LPS sulfotransferase NodH
LQPFVFIVGCARSGTTLLQRLMDAHPLLAIAPEMHWITNAFKRSRWNARQCLVTTEMLGALAAHEMFPQLEVGREDFLRLVSSDKPIKGAKFLTRFFGLYRRTKGKLLVGSKTPAYVRRLEALHALWPETKFVHLIRDGRAVCLSVLDWNHAERTAGRYATWAQDPVTTAALWWERKVQLGREGGRLLGPGLYCEVRYESLVADPAKECASLCAFLGVPYEAAMVRFHEGRARTDQPDHPWRPIMPGLRDWRSQMPADALERFEAAAGNLLDQLGYPRANPHARPDAERHAASIRRLFTANASSQGDRLPELW